MCSDWQCACCQSVGYQISVVKLHEIFDKQRVGVIFLKAGGGVLERGIQNKYINFHPIQERYEPYRCILDWLSLSP